MKLKLNDVYRFSYNVSWTERMFDPYWCFDGQLVVKENKNGLYLEDTYWNSSEGRKFTLEEALERGTLTFVCNLDDVKECQEYDTQFYADEDIFNLSHQHGCYKKYCIRKGAKRSAEKMKAVLNEKIEESERKIKWLTSDVESYKKKLQEVENGNLDIYF